MAYNIQQKLHVKIASILKKFLKKFFLFEQFFYFYFNNIAKRQKHSILRNETFG